MKVTYSIGNHMDREKSISKNLTFPLLVSLRTVSFMEKTVSMKLQNIPMWVILRMEKKMEKECCWRN